MRKFFLIFIAAWGMIVFWAVFDIWIHDYGIVPYYEKYGLIQNAREAYLFGFWSFAVLNSFVIALLAGAWRWFSSLIVLAVCGTEDLMYYVLLPILNRPRADKFSEFMPDELEWLNSNFWLKFLSGGDTVSEQGIYFGVAIGITAVTVILIAGKKSKF